MLSRIEYFISSNPLLGRCGRNPVYFLSFAVFIFWILARLTGFFHGDIYPPNEELHRLKTAFDNLYKIPISEATLLDPLTQDYLGFHFAGFLYDKFYFLQSLIHAITGNIPHLRWANSFYIEFISIGLATLVASRLLNFGILSSFIFFTGSMLAQAPRMFLYPPCPAVYIGFPLILAGVYCVISGTKESKKLGFVAIWVGFLTIFVANFEVLVFSLVNLSFFIFLLAPLRKSLFYFVKLIIFPVVFYSIIFFKHYQALFHLVDHSSRSLFFEFGYLETITRGAFAFFLTFPLSPQLRIGVLLGGIFLMMFYMVRRYSVEKTFSVRKTLFFFSILYCVMFVAMYTTLPSSVEIFYYQPLFKEASFQFIAQVFLAYPPLFVLSLVYIFIYLREDFKGHAKGLTKVFPVILWLIFISYFCQYTVDVAHFRIEYFPDNIVSPEGILQSLIFFFILIGSFSVIAMRSGDRLYRIAIGCGCFGFLLLYHANGGLLSLNGLIQTGRFSYFLAFFFAIVAVHGLRLTVDFFTSHFRSKPVQVVATLIFVFFVFEGSIVVFKGDNRYQATEGSSDRNFASRIKGVPEYLETILDRNRFDYKIFQDLDGAKSRMWPFSLEGFVPYRVLYGHDSFVRYAEVDSLWGHKDWASESIVSLHPWNFTREAVRLAGFTHLSKRFDYITNGWPVNFETPFKEYRQDSLRLSGVRYVTSFNPALDDVFDNYRKIGHFKNDSPSAQGWGWHPVEIFIYELKNSISRAEVRNIKLTSHEKRLVDGYDQMSDLDIDKYAYIHAAGRSLSALSGNKDIGSVSEINSRSIDDFLVKVSPSQSKRILVTTEFYDSNWRATISGQDVETTRVNFSYLGVVLGNDQQEVRFKYQMSLSLAAYIGIITGGLGMILLGLLGFLVFRVRQEATFEI